MGSGGLNRIRKGIARLGTGDLDHTLACDMVFDPSVYKEPKPAVPRHIVFHVFESREDLAALAGTLKERFPKG